MKTITSGENPAYKEAMKLRQKKYRDRNGCFLLEGDKLVAEALRGHRVQTIFVREGRKTAPNTESSRICRLARPLFDRLAQTEHDQGILAVVRKPDQVRLGCGHVVVLDRLQDPGNIGTIIRTAEAAGYAGVLTVRGTGDVYGDKAVRAAAGSLLRVPILQMEGADQVIGFLEETDRQVIVTDPAGTDSPETVDWSRDAALIIGNEGNGVSSEFAGRADYSVRIPMAGGTESLNAAVAAGILMYQSIRKG